MCIHIFFYLERKRICFVFPNIEQTIHNIQCTKHGLRRLNPAVFIECPWRILILTVRMTGKWILLNGNGHAGRMIPILGMNIFSPYAWPIMTVACVMKVYRHFTNKTVPAQRIGGVKFRKHKAVRQFQALKCLVAYPMFPKDSVERFSSHKQLKLMSKFQAFFFSSCEV
jgi:hypothetical protein